MANDSAEATVPGWRNGEVVRCSRVAIDTEVLMVESGKHSKKWYIVELNLRLKRCALAAILSLIVYPAYFK